MKLSPTLLFLLALPASSDPIAPPNYVFEEQNGILPLEGLNWRQIDNPAPARKPFPAHWGDPPRIQTRDYVPLPGGYGHGSGTLKKWIQKNLDKDKEAAKQREQERPAVDLAPEQNPAGRLNAASFLAGSKGPDLQQPRSKDGDGSITVSGELKQWHKLTLTLDGPFAHEQDIKPNPFTDYALNVTFTHESGQPSYHVPGYFAADGNAADSSAQSGTKWRVHLSPDKPGQWSYTVSFLTALNYLSSTGANAFSFLPYNAGGDGDNVWPFVFRDDPLHYDCSKLDQWGIVLDHATARGLFAHFKMQETENDDNVPTALDGGDLGPERVLYCRELIARFGTSSPSTGTSARKTPSPPNSRWTWPAASPNSTPTTTTSSSTPSPTNRTRSTNLSSARTPPSREPLSKIPTSAIVTHRS